MSIMVGNGKQRRIQERVIELLKKTGHWDPDKKLSDCVESMALFCIKHKNCKEQNGKGRKKI